MNEYIDLETGKKSRNKARADKLYKAGHRIRVLSEGKPVCEWIPGSHDYYTWEGGKKVLRHPSTERR